MNRPPETALYAPVKAFFERHGYRVKGEIRGCDVVAVHDHDGQKIAVIELKLGFSLDLVLQGVDRCALADEVWLAVRAARVARKRDTRIVKLCRMLGFGLLAINPRTNAVEVRAEPGRYRARGNLQRRVRLLREYRDRRGDPTAGGGSRQPVMTAYRQRALACAAALADGPRRVRDLAAAVPDAGLILLRNVYGWFERERRGVYRLRAAGYRALNDARQKGEGSAQSADRWDPTRAMPLQPVT
ncbi:MAG: hypothetical protein JO264_10375 [Acidisphaera sp.]|nr:hypothetical protein [Acidisphaera sp.]